VRSVWQRADLCVIPSRTGEGMPRVMLEAAACGRPLIVTDVPGCRQFVRDGVEGMVVPPESAERLAAAIEALVNDAALRASMGEAARARVLSGYTEAHIEKEVERVFRLFLDETSTTRVPVGYASELVTRL
jgi:glycosyltransferase involved in cell wall biosynthesis